MPQITRSARADYDTTNAIRTPNIAGLQASLRARCIAFHHAD